MANNNNSTNRIKVSCCFLPVRGRPTGLLTINYTTPYELFSENNLAQTISQIVNDLESRVENIGNQDIRYSVSANYFLLNSLTNEVRLFFGNFAVNESNLILIQQFVEYRGQNHLRATISDAISQNNIDNVLIKPFHSSSWQFSYFRDITISFQIRTSLNALDINKGCYTRPIHEFL